MTTKGVLFSTFNHILKTQREKKKQLKTKLNQKKKKKEHKRCNIFIFGIVKSLNHCNINSMK